MQRILRSVYLQLLLVLVCFSNASGLIAQALKVGEVYDYNVGDEFIIQRDRNGPPIYTNVKVISRTDFGTDSVRYLFETTVYNLNTVSKLWESVKTNHYSTFKNLIDTFFESFMQQDTMQYDTFNNKSFLVNERKDSVLTDTCGATINYRYRFSGSPLSENETFIYKAIKGVGMLQYYELDGGKDFYEDYLLYSKKGANACGNSKSIPTSIKTVNKKSSVKIWPNPAKDWLNIGGEPLFGFKIFDVTGREVLSALIADENPIDISSLRRGLYTIVVVTAIKGTITFKLTVVE
ncbi:MAG: T9SS type A sorting domain-containing protein [Bacteroidota bacterium]